jgi:hypothetical protein
MPEAAPRARNCPAFRHSDARYERVAQAISEATDWQSANQIAEITKDVPLDVAYQMRRLIADGKVERKSEEYLVNRWRVLYRAVR